MNYQKHYNLLVERGKNRIPLAVFETHHIIPKCMGGNNDKENLVDLTSEEHFVAHQLLVKIYPEQTKLIYAAHMMGNTRINNKSYGWLRRKFTENLMGHPNWNLTVTEETKDKIAKSMKDLLSILTPEEISDRMIKSCHSLESWTPQRIENMRKGMIGKKKTKTPKLLAAIESRRERSIQNMLKAADNRRGKTWKIIDGKRIWITKEKNQ